MPETPHSQIGRYFEAMRKMKAAEREQDPARPDTAIKETVLKVEEPAEWKELNERLPTPNPKFPQATQLPSPAERTTKLYLWQQGPRPWQPEQYLRRGNSPTSAWDLRAPEFFAEDLPSFTIPESDDVVPATYEEARDVRQGRLTGRFATARIYKADDAFGRIDHDLPAIRIEPYEMAEEDGGALRYGSLLYLPAPLEEYDRPLYFGGWQVDRNPLFDYRVMYTVSMRPSEYPTFYFFLRHGERDPLAIQSADSTEGPPISPFTPEPTERQATPEATGPSDEQPEPSPVYSATSPPRPNKKPSYAGFVEESSEEEEARKGSVTNDSPKYIDSPKYNDSPKYTDQIASPEEVASPDYGAVADQPERPNDEVAAEPSPRASDSDADAAYSPINPVFLEETGTVGYSPIDPVFPDEAGSDDREKAAETTQKEVEVDGKITEADEVDAEGEEDDELLGQERIGGSEANDPISSVENPTDYIIQSPSVSPSRIGRSQQQEEQDRRERSERESAPAPEPSLDQDHITTLQSSGATTPPSDPTIAQPAGQSSTDTPARSTIRADTAPARIQHTDSTTTTASGMAAQPDNLPAPTSTSGCTDDAAPHQAPTMSAASRSRKRANVDSAHLSSKRVKLDDGRVGMRTARGRVSKPPKRMG
ncbi:hypothetical protein BDZ85DRAFT_249217 [Elsinoe ampelina]|uniref:Uncharacterized protein n=1 Tax=Elsinoe ampelina TaxID=302913 RepID=A0A6A6GGI6_9PEZI|nr:hypothetical protein BDZ85DRAFT_249217 [Elsinoe ampelina]